MLLSPRARPIVNKYSPSWVRTFLGMASSFASVDTSAWPVVVIRYAHANPSTAEASAYFTELGRILNDKATPEQPCAIVFDASGVPLSSMMLGVNTDFFAAHNDFNKLYYERFKAVCSGFGIVVAQALLRAFVKTALAFAPPTHPCTEFTSTAEAIKTLSAKC